MKNQTGKVRTGTRIAKPAQLIRSACQNLSPRSKEVIEARFGLSGGPRQTLESIGRNYNITRERVRQIERAGLNQLKKEGFSSFEPLLKLASQILAEHGGIMTQQRLLEEMAEAIRGQETDKRALYLIIKLDDSLDEVKEDDKFYSAWKHKQASLAEAEKIIDNLIKAIEPQKKLVSEEELPKLLPQNIRPADKTLWAFIDLTKKIDKNPFNQWGLKEWPEVSPRGVKDRAYLVLKSQDQPLHFTKITDLINQTGFSSRPAYPQTVHNELIKDGRFVLVGRGTYALAEWGYQPGTVRQVLEQILRKEKQPLTKEELAQKVLETRMVKKNTVLLNLQNCDSFVKTEDGRYTLKK